MFLHERRAVALRGGCWLSRSVSVRTVAGVERDRRDRIVPASRGPSGVQTGGGGGGGDSGPRTLARGRGSGPRRPGISVRPLAPRPSRAVDRDPRWGIHRGVAIRGPRCCPGLPGSDRRAAHPAGSPDGARGIDPVEGGSPLVGPERSAGLSSTGLRSNGPRSASGAAGRFEPRRRRVVTVCARRSGAPHP